MRANGGLFLLVQNLANSSGRVFWDNKCVGDWSATGVLGWGREAGRIKLCRLQPSLPIASGLLGMHFRPFSPLIKFNFSFTLSCLSDTSIPRISTRYNPPYIWPFSGIDISYRIFILSILSAIESLLIAECSLLFDHCFLSYCSFPPCLHPFFNLRPDNRVKQFCSPHLNDFSEKELAL